MLRTELNDKTIVAAADGEEGEIRFVAQVRNTLGIVRSGLAGLGVGGIGQGHIDGGGGIGGESDIQCERIGSGFPSGDDLAVDGIVFALGPRHPSAGTRLNDGVFITGVFRVGIDSGHVAVNPLADCAQGVMVERVHAGILEAPAFDPAVPSFPDRRRAAFDRVAPGGHAVL